MNNKLLTGALILFSLGTMSFCSAWGQFNPDRQFPDTWDRIAVFVDQLPDLTGNEAQARFAASHYVGSQKLTDQQVDAIRAHSNDFIMLQYRLGTRDSGHTTQLILPKPGGGTHWSTDWADIKDNEAWFEHYDGKEDSAHRVYNDYKSIKEYCMKLDESGWRNFWVNRVADAVTTSKADGVFADSTHLPYAIPNAQQATSRLGTQPHEEYIPILEAYYDHVYQEMTNRNMYFIPNIGSLVTTADTTEGYYQDVHGAMVEGFATRSFSYADWKLQASRTLKLLNNDKVWIAQNGSDGTPARRMWYLANYLLLKRKQSYVNIGGAGSELHWWPEYEIDLGEPVDDAKVTDPDGVGPLDLIDSLATGTEGVYLREFKKGLVLVNALRSDSTVFTLPEGQTFWRVMPIGGGAIGADGTLADPAYLEYEEVSGQITLDEMSGTVLMYVPEPTSAMLLGGGSLLLLRRLGRMARR